MTRADRVLSTPPTNTSVNNPPVDQPMTYDDKLGMAWWNALSERERAKWSAIAGNTGRVKDAWEAFKRGSPDQSPPIDQTRRRFLAVAAVGSFVGAGSLAAAAMAPSVPAAVIVPKDPAFALIAEKRAADVAHDAACDAFSEAEERYGVASAEANDEWERGGPACHAAMEAGWPLATIPPTTLAGVAAVLRFANEIEDAGNEWPGSDVVGPKGWHYQLRATMAAAVEALLKAQAGKAVTS